MKITRWMMVTLAIAMAAWLGSGCSLDGQPARGEDDGIAKTSDEIDRIGVSSIAGEPPAGVDPSQTPATRALCIRDPFPPGRVLWFNNPNPSEWRTLPENGSGWIGAGGSQNADAIHRLGWGCTVLKVPSHCTLTVGAGNVFDCCCNAAASVFKGVCRWENFSALGPHRPPGC